MKRCLFFMPGPVTPETEADLSRFAAVSKYFNGDVVQTTWKKTPELDKKLQDSIKGFHFHLIDDTREFWLFRSLKQVLFFVRTGLSLSRQNGRYDLVVSYGLTKTAFAAYVVKLFTGARMIVEVPCNPSKAFVEAKSSNLNAKIKSWLAKTFTAFIFRKADGLRLLYPNQLDGFLINPKASKRVFHEFIPVSYLSRSSTDEDYIMLLGCPWYLKGFDIAIEAFKKIAHLSPTLKLKIVGYIPEDELECIKRDYGNGDSRIEFLKPMTWKQAMDCMSRCKFFVLASRSEAMGRVWLEAMALGKPVICSAVDGVVHYIKHEKNGLLFKSEDITDLANCMQRLLTDMALREQLSNEGFSYAHEELNEYHYVEEYNKLASDVIEYR